MAEKSFMDTGKAVGELMGLKVTTWAKSQAIQQTSERRELKLQKVAHNCFQDFMAIAILLSLSPPSKLLFQTKLRS